MPPKQRITREMILEASFAMFCKEGMEVVNARSVAKALNCSTQPIFSYFAGMDDLKNALEQKACELFEEGIAEALSSDEPLFSGCMAYYTYALNQPNLFRQLFLIRRDKAPSNLAEINEALIEKVVKPLSEKLGVDVQHAQEQCVKLWIYTHGMASLVAMGLMDLSKERAEEMLREVEKHYSLK